LSAVFEFDPRAPDPATQELREKTAWTQAELNTAVFPEPVWAVPGILPVGLCFLAGRPKVGKSWLALQIAHAVGTGGQVFGERVKKGKALYLALEDSPRRLQERSRKQRIPSHANISYLMEWPAFYVEGGLTRLQDKVKENEYTLVIIDTLSRALGKTDQLDLAQMTEVLGSIQKDALWHDVTILAIDHHRKSNGSPASPIDDLLGSTGKSAVGDALLGLYKERGKQEVTLMITGRDLEEKELVLRWDGLTCSWQLVGEAGKVRENTGKALILRAIQELEGLGELATSTNIAKYVDRSQSYVAHLLADLLNDGEVIKTDKVGASQPYKVTHIQHKDHTTHK